MAETSSVPSLRVCMRTLLEGALAYFGRELDATGPERGDDAAVHEQVAACDEARLGAEQERRGGRDLVRRAHALRRRRVDQRPVGRADWRVELVLREGRE